MLSVPYKLHHDRPFHTAEDDVCVRWRSLFLTVLHFGAQVYLEDLKTQIHTPPPPKTKTKGGEGKNKRKEKTKHRHGALCKLCAVPFYFKISWQMTKTNI